MVSQTAVRHALQNTTQAFQAYAAAQGWKSEDFRVFVRVNEDWGQIHVILVAKAFPGRNREEKWLDVLDFVSKELKNEPDLAEALHLNLRTFDEVAEGGLYAIGPGYSDVRDMLITPLAADK